MSEGWSQRPLDLLETGTSEGKKWAASSLRNLASTSAEQRAQIVESGAVPLLVELLRSGTQEAIEEAGGALRALAVNCAPHQDAIVRAGAIPVLIELLHSLRAGIAEQAAGTLMHLASSSARHRRKIVVGGALPALVNMIRSKIVMATIVINNVDLELLESQRLVEKFEGVVQEIIAEKVGHEVQPADVSLGLAATFVRHQAVQAPGVWAHCTVNVHSSVDAGAVQAKLRASEEVCQKLVRGLTGAGLAHNKLRSIKVDSITTPATVSFTMRVGGVDFIKLFVDDKLLDAFRSRIQSAVAAEVGTIILQQSVSVSLRLGSDVVACRITPPAKTDASLVLLYLKSTTSLGDTVAQQLEAGENQGASAQSLKDALTGPVTATDLSEPILTEMTYARTGSRGEQTQAAGALKNLVVNDIDNQDAVVSEGAVPALTGLLEPHVPFGDIFAKFDSDGSGGITEPELQTGLSRLGWPGPVHDIWVELDRDHSGAITFEEFVDRLTEEMEEHLEGRGKGIITDFLVFLQGLYDNTLIHEQAAGALRNLTANNIEAIEAVIEAGAVLPLISLMQSKVTEVRENAHGALQSVAATWASKMVARLKTGPLPEREQAAQALRKLANVNAEHRRTVLEAGAVSPLISLLQSGSPTCQDHATAALNNIMFKDPEHEKLVVAAGAVPHMLTGLKSKFRDLQTEAVRTVKMLVAGSPISQRKMVEAGGIELLVALLKPAAAEERVQRRVVDILMKLANIQEFRKQVLKAKLVEVLMELAKVTDDLELRRCSEDAVLSFEEAQQQ